MGEASCTRTCHHHIIITIITIITLTTHLMASLILALLLAVVALRLSRLARLGDTERDRVLPSVDIIYCILDIFIVS